MAMAGAILKVFLCLPERCDSVAFCCTVSVLIPRPVTQCGPWWLEGCVSGSICTESTRPRCRDACPVLLSERPSCEYAGGVWHCLPYVCMHFKAGQVTLQIDNALKWVLGHVTFVLHTVKDGSSHCTHCTRWVRSSHVFHTL